MITDYCQRPVVRVWYLSDVVYSPAEWNDIDDIASRDELFASFVVEHRVDTSLTWCLSHVSQYLY